MAQIALVYFDAGGGHRSTATAIRDALQKDGCDAHPALVNLQEILDSIDFIRRFTGVRVQDVYNQMVRNQWTLGSPQMLRLLQAAIRIYHRPTVKILKEYWRRTQFDMVVSFVPHFNRAMHESFASECPGRPFVTVLTDFADYPPHFWMERQSQYVVCGTEKAVHQAGQMGHPADKVFRTSGMVLNPRFYELAPVDRAAERIKLGLDPNRPTGIVLFGGQGARNSILEIDDRLSRAGLPIQLIVICGKNDRLAAALRARNSNLPRLIEGFTTEVPYYMQLADFFIGKPGPGSVAEALAMKLPVIVERNAWTLPQERYNTDWIAEHRAGLVVRNFRNIAGAVAELLANLSMYRRNAAAVENRALFEVVDILKTIGERQFGKPGFMSPAHSERTVF
jgi:UDP-N-acetylglucosamine:LPS N-acetylglucosamine transferase